MDNYSLSSDEFDWLVEIIVAILFMSVGIFGIVSMTRTLQKQTEVTSTVDKVTVSSVDQEEVYPFVYTGYQAYMFAWMMDGHDPTALMWAGQNDNSIGKLTTTQRIGDTYGSSAYIVLDPSKETAGFIVKRNRAIIGADEYKDVSVKNTIISSLSSPDEEDVIDMYMGNTTMRWRLELNDSHVNAFTREMLDGTKELNDVSVAGAAITDLFEERKDYIWTLHPCAH